MNKLSKSRSVSSTLSENRKYYIECDEMHTPNRLEIIKLLKEQHDEDSKVLLALLSETENKINVKDHPFPVGRAFVVVKMGKTNATIQNEYNISQILDSTKCPGFIKFRCLFSCYDKRGKQNSSKICEATSSTGIRRDVLIMEYFSGGSIESHSWCETNFHVLRSLLIQILLSCLMAYNLTGFIHYDLHLGNVLIKRTKKQITEYEINDVIYEINTNNHIPIIMDFENCTVSQERTTHNQFWDSIDNTINRIKYDLKTKNKDFIKSSLDNVSIFILQNKNKHYMKLLEIIPMIETAEFWVEKRKEVMSYDPNIFGGNIKK